MLISKRGTIQELPSQFEEEVQFLAGHLFRADWQLKQFKDQRTMEPFPDHSVCMVLDFAENFTCSYQVCIIGVMRLWIYLPFSRQSHERPEVSF
jgi:hypothetical protein